MSTDYGKGIQIYRRTKLVYTGNDCLGKKTGKKYCNTQRCPIIRPNGPGSGCSVECKSISCEVSKGRGAKAAMGSCFLPPYQTSCSGIPSGCGSCVSQCSNGQGPRNRWSKWSNCFKGIQRFYYREIFSILNIWRGKFFVLHLKKARSTAPVEVDLFNLNCSILKS